MTDNTWIFDITDADGNIVGHGSVAGPDLMTAVSHVRMAAVRSFAEASGEDQVQLSVAG